MAILQDLSKNETLEQELARLREENAKLKAAKSNGVSFKVSDKGAVSMYGLGRFPVTLYLSQWEKLSEAMPKLAEFLVEHVAELSVKE